MSIDCTYDNSEILKIMPPSVREIYTILSLNNPLLISDIIYLSKYSRRTIQQALKILIDARLVKKQPDLTDLRRKYFKIA